MSSQKDVYLHVKSLIQAIPEIKHFDSWNNNVQESDNVRPFSKPAVFFDYDEIQWEENTYGGGFSNCTDQYPIQYGEIRFTLHVVVDKKSSALIDYDEINQYDTIELVRRAINYTRVDGISGVIQVTLDTKDVGHNTMLDHMIQFKCRVMASGATQVTPENPSGTIENIAPVEFNKDIDYSR